MEKADIFRMFLIGIAPLILGGAFLISISLFFIDSFNLHTAFSSPFEVLKTFGFIWVIFFTTNTMFSSKKDMQGAIVLLGVHLTALITVILLGFDFLAFLESLLLSDGVVVLVERLVVIFTIPVSFNLLFSLVALLFLKDRLRLWS